MALFEHAEKIGLVNESLSYKVKKGLKNVKYSFQKKSYFIWRIWQIKEKTHRWSCRSERSFWYNFYQKRFSECYTCSSWTLWSSQKEKTSRECSKTVYEREYQKFWSLHSMAWNNLCENGWEKRKRFK